MSQRKETVDGLKDLRIRLLFAMDAIDRIGKAIEQIERLDDLIAPQPDETYGSKKEVWRCGECGSVVSKTRHDKFCRNCGRAVKWE